MRMEAGSGVHPSRREGPARTRAKTLLLFLASVAVSLLLLEAAVRVLGVDAPRIDFEHPNLDGTFLTYDPWLGWRNPPNNTFYYKGQPYSTNAQGFRHVRDYASTREQKLRVAVLGDSQVFGMFVPMNVHFALRLEQRYPDLEMLLFGVPGYGPTQELLLLESILPRFDFRSLLVVLFLENDLIDTTLVMNHEYKQKPYPVLTGGQIEIRNVPVPIPIIEKGVMLKKHLRPNALLFRNSGLFRSLSYLLARGEYGVTDSLQSLGLVEIIDSSGFRYRKRFGFGHGFLRADGLAIECAEAVTCPHEHQLDGLPNVLAIYGEMRRMCERRGRTFHVLVDPPASEMRRGRFDRTRRVAAALRTEGFDVIDFSRMVEARQEAPGNFIAQDLHWNAAGNRLAAEAIDAGLIGRLMEARRAGTKSSGPAQ